MTLQMENPGGQSGASAFTSTNSSANYSRFHNLLISLVIWRVLPIFLVDWFINRGGKLHDN